MRPQHTLKISEVFASIKGEGLRQGEPALFVRTAGCNLRCSFCDTKAAWTGGRRFDQESVLERLRRLNRRFPAEWVCLTGGEPLLQDVGPLVEAVKKEGWNIHLETNGTIWRPLPVDWLTVSPKPPAYDVRPEFRRRASEVKVVVVGGLTLETLRSLRRRFPLRAALVLQPRSGRRESAALGLELLGECLRSGLKNVRLMVQAHKVLGLK